MEDKLFRVYFANGSEEVVSAVNMMCALNYVLYIQEHSADSIVRIEEEEL